MRSERRRRGRAIRRARRLTAARAVEVSIQLDATAFSRKLAQATLSLTAAANALVKIHDASIVTARVIFERFGLAYLSPSAGARRQLLEHGRAPKGRR